MNSSIIKMTLIIGLVVVTLTATLTSGRGIIIHQSSPPFAVMESRMIGSPISSHSHSNGGSIGTIINTARSSSSPSVSASASLSSPSSSSSIPFMIPTEQLFRQSVLMNGGGGERGRRGLFSSLAGIASGGLMNSFSSVANSALSPNKETNDDGDGGGSVASSIASGAVGALTNGLVSSNNKPKPYDFNEVEMTAIQAIVSLRDIIGDLFHKVGLNIPSLASLITRSEFGSDGKFGDHHSSVSSSGSSSSSSGASSVLSALTSTKSTNVGVQLLRGLALSLPLLIPMATQIRRMSSSESSALSSSSSSLSSSLFSPSSSYSSHSSSSSALPQFVSLAQLPQIPMIPDIYYNQALHRRRGKRSAPTARETMKFGGIGDKYLQSSSTQQQLSQQQLLQSLQLLNSLLSLANAEQLRRQTMMDDNNSSNKPEQVNEQQVTKTRQRQH